MHKFVRERRGENLKREQKHFILLKPLFVLAISLLLTVSAFAESLVPGGRALGIRMSTDGVIVAGLTEVKTQGGSLYPARDAGIQPGDLIVRVGGKDIQSGEDFLASMRELDNETVSVTFEREGRLRQVNVTPAECDDGSRKLGVMLRDGISGVGTLTFYDPESGIYGALGHSISDADTGEILPLAEGEIYAADISGVTRGAVGTPGALNGSADTDCVLGSIGINCACGIFGKAELNGEGTIETGEMKTGEATILCTVGGSETGEYKIEISRVCKTPDSCTAVLHVTDPKLIELCGGIVQGMSGSPIIQDGRLVGAVTHVFINDPTGGYGISIQDMLEAAEKCIGSAA